MMRFKLFLTMINFYGIVYGSNYCYLNDVSTKSNLQNPKCSLLNLKYSTSSATFYQTLFSTGKVIKCLVKPAGDTVIRYNCELNKFNLRRIKLLRQTMKFGYSSQKNNTNLLLMNTKRKYLLQIKEKGKFEFIGINDGKVFFTFILNNCHVYFSIQLTNSKVELIEYTV